MSDIANIHGGVGVFHCRGADVSGDWAERYEQFLHQDSHKRKLVKLKGKAKGLYVAENRNKCVQVFLPWEPKLDWMLFLDTDIIFTVDDFYALYDIAVANHCDVLGGLYWTFWHGNQLTTTWLEDTGNQGEMRLLTRPREGMNDLASIGMGFTLIHRRVLEGLQAVKPNHRWAWFGHDEAIMPDGWIDCMGEDVSFCARAIKAGFKVQGFSGVSVGHDKRVVLTSEACVKAELEQSKLKESA